MKTAIIIKGNPELIVGNPLAEEFYNKLKFFLEKLGYAVSFDPGEPYTTPAAADLWIGHSRGADRLRFAPPGTVTIGIGVPETEEPPTFAIINHPDDTVAKRRYQGGKLAANDATDDSHHYTLTEAMKRALAQAIKNGQSKD